MSDNRMAQPQTTIITYINGVPYVGNQEQESVVTDPDEEYDDSYADEDTLMGEPAGETDV
jgi:hypothetical protein